MSAGPPNCRRDMLRAGYKLLNAKASCNRCRMPYEWWQTTNGKKLPFDPSSMPGIPPADDPSLAVLHRCKEAPTAMQQSLFQGTPAERQKALGLLAAACRARCVVLIQDDGYHYSFRPGLKGDELAHELISAANKIRRDLERDHEA